MIEFIGEPGVGDAEEASLDILTEESMVDDIGLQREAAGQAEDIMVDVVAFLDFYRRDIRIRVEETNVSCSELGEIPCLPIWLLRIVGVLVVEDSHGLGYYASHLTSLCIIEIACHWSRSSLFRGLWSRFPINGNDVVYFLAPTENV